MELLDFFKTFYNLPQKDYDLFINEGRIKNCTKGELIVKPGQVQKEMLIVIEGVQMSYYESEAKEHVIAFTYSPGLCALPGSFSFQKPSSYYLKCLTPSKFRAIHYEKLQELFEKSTELERLFRKLAEGILAGVIDRHVQLHTLTIEERFKAFCGRSAHLLHLIPHKYIASYLNIDATNFSKLFNQVKL